MVRLLVESSLMPSRQTLYNLYRLSLLLLAIVIPPLFSGCTQVEASNSHKVVLQFSLWDGDESMRVIRKLVAQFEQENPDIEVRLINIADYNMYHQKMLVTYAGNAAPDVAMMDPPHFQALAVRGALLPLNPLFKDDPTFDLKAYYKPIVDAHSLDGTLYVLPRDIAPSGLIYYNKRMFDEAGIPYPDGSWTWDFKERPELKEKDFTWIVHQLTKFDRSGKVSRYGLTPGWSLLFLNSLGYSYGLTDTDNPQKPTKILTGSPDWIKVGDWMGDLEFKKKWVAGQLDVTSVLQSSANQIFINQKTAMFESGIWEVPNIRKYMPTTAKNFFDWDFTLFPAYQGRPPHMPTGGSGYAIFSSCPHPKEAWRLVKFMAGPVGMRAMAQAGIAQPAIRSVALSDAWLPGPNTPKEQQYPHSRILTDVAVDRVVFDPTSEFWPDAVDLLNGKLDNFYNGIGSAKEALTTGTELAQSRLDYLQRKQDAPVFNWKAGAAVGITIALLIAAYVYLPDRRERYTLRMRRENRSAYLFLSPWLFGLVTLTLGPMILSLLMSTTDWDMMLPAKWRGAGNYVEAATIDPRFWVSLKVTFIYTLVRVPLGIVFAFFLALLLNQKIKGIPLFRTFFYVPSLVSTVAAALVWRKLFAPDGGLINTILYSPFMEKYFHLGSSLTYLASAAPGSQVNWLGNEKTALASFIVMSMWGVGGSMVILLAGLQGIPDFYYEAATVDGATPWHKLKAITVPLLTPAIFFTLVTGLIGAFQSFTEVYVITTSAGGPNNATMLFMLNIYKAGFEAYRFGYVACLAWVLFFVILGFTLFQLRMSKWVHYESEVK